jgi:hypothetical protein
MKSRTGGNNALMAKWILYSAVTFSLLGLPLPAFAALGASVDSVRDDQVRLQARIAVTAGGPYEVHELTSALGTVVREYVSPNGKVFAVSWQGPFMPDLKQLLGNYFEQYLSAAKEKRQRQSGRLPLNIEKPSLVMQNSGHLRAYSGRAYDPGLLPAGVSADDLR